MKEGTHLIVNPYSGDNDADYALELDSSSAQPGAGANPGANGGPTTLRVTAFQHLRRSLEEQEGLPEIDSLRGKVLAVGDCEDGDYYGLVPGYRLDLWTGPSETGFVKVEDVDTVLRVIYTGPVHRDVADDEVDIALQNYGDV